ncbi:phage terminase small subunit [Alteraurantiacibacter buctensis]|uniref:Terminase n=1 Tax=Alteraurantiacibacter buctensis TaxID=1503981 RepID=A0A844Z4L8_9SPHN|nr:phage terminase small subunit [Alteraurantiacibacter buctensis]MXO73577.1 terminase [Alteraurantiacibacter buctensis]
MTFSPALRHRQKVLAALASDATRPLDSAPAAPTEGAAGAEYAALLAVLHEAVRGLSDIASHEARQPKKAELAKVFADWIEGVLAADQPVQDEILIVNMIWAIDYRDFDYALRLADFALRHGLAMPERYNRTVACFLAEDVAELALKESGAVSHDVLVRVHALTGAADMPDPAKAKLMKALGRSWVARADDFNPAADNAPAGGAQAYLEQAQECFTRALALDQKSGVKTDLKMLEKRLAPAPAS